MDDPTMALVAGVLTTGVRAAVPIFLAGLGEVFSERAGVVNLGIEGMMLVGAIGGYAVAAETGSPGLGLLVGGACGCALAAVHAGLTLRLRVDQFACGIALIFLGRGLSAHLGEAYVGRAIEGWTAWHVPLLTRIPILGPAFFQQDAVVLVSLATIPVAWFILNRSAWGLRVRAVGDDPEASALLGVPVLRVRAQAVLLGGLLAGLAGAYLSIIYARTWTENMVAGRGLVALALVVFASWKPVRCAVGALFFGLLQSFQLHAQASGVEVSSYLLGMLPYVLTLAALVVAQARLGKTRGGVPRALGRPFSPPT